LVEVSGTPKLKFSGYPSAYVIPSDNTADYETNRENIRTYAFLIRMFHETKASGVQEAIEALEGLTDDILDLFDKEDLKNSDSRTIGVSLPAGYTFINIFANPSSWGELTDDGLVFTQINVRVRVSIDISS